MAFASKKYVMIVEEDEAQLLHLCEQMKKLQLPVLAMDNAFEALQLLNKTDEEKFCPSLITESYTCPKCSMKFRNIKLLTNHRRKKNSPCHRGELDCLECNQPFSTTVSVAHHKVVHKHAREKLYLQSLEARVKDLEKALSNRLGIPNLVISGTTASRLEGMQLKERLVAVVPEVSEETAERYTHARMTVMLPIDADKLEGIKSCIKF